MSRLILLSQWLRPMLSKSANYRDLSGADENRRKRGFVPKSVVAAARSEGTKAEGKVKPEGGAVGVTKVLASGQHASTGPR